MIRDNVHHAAATSVTRIAYQTVPIHIRYLQIFGQHFILLHSKRRKKVIKLIARSNLKSIFSRASTNFISVYNILFYLSKIKGRLHDITMTVSRARLLFQWWNYFFAGCTQCYDIQLYCTLGGIRRPSSLPNGSPQQTGYPDADYGMDKMEGHIVPTTNTTSNVVADVSQHEKLLFR